MMNYTKIPNELFEPCQLNMQERFLYCTLLKFCGKNDSCFPSQQKLSKILGCSTRHVGNLLKKLLHEGLINKKRRGWNRSNTYFVSRDLFIDRKSASPLIGNRFPLHTGNIVPLKSTYLKGKDKTNIKGLENMRRFVNENIRTI